jgi:hypothetical protein
MYFLQQFFVVLAVICGQHVIYLDVIVLHFVVMLGQLSKGSTLALFKRSCQSFHLCMLETFTLIEVSELLLDKEHILFVVLQRLCLLFLLEVDLPLAF